MVPSLLANNILAIDYPKRVAIIFLVTFGCEEEVIFVELKRTSMHTHTTRITGRCHWFFAATKYILDIQIYDTNLIVIDLDI